MPNVFIPSLYRLYTSYVCTTNNLGQLMKYV